MASAGTVTVDFAAQTAKFTAELKKVRGDLAILKKDSASVSATLGKFGSTIRGIVSIGAVVGTVRAVVRATAEAEANQAQLNAALAAARADVKAASAEFQAYAAELQRTTTFSDDAIVQVQTLLLSFAGLSGPIVKQATASVLDLSTRMGIDAPAAAKLLGKALAEPEKGITQLARSGVIFNDQQKDQIRTLVENGRTMEAQSIILQTLETSFGGAAVAARDTFGGALAGLNNAVGDLLEGKSGVNAASDAINDLTDVLTSEDVKAGFAIIIAGLANVIGFAARAASGLAGFAKGVGEFFGELVSGPAGMSEGQLVARIEEVEQLRQRTIDAREDMDGATLAVSRQLVKEYDEQLVKLRELLALRKEYGDFGVDVSTDPARSLITTADASNALNFTTGGEDDGPTEAQRRAAEERQRIQERIAEYIYRSEMGLVQSIIEDGTAIVAAEQQAEVEAYESSLQARIAAEQEAASQRFSIESDLQAQLLDLRQGAANAAIGLLQFMAQRSRAAAIGLILVNRALAITQAVQNTAAAATKALAVYGPTPQGFAAAAAAKTFGAIQIGLIAATGALEVASVGGGGGGPAVAPGTPNNPIFTRTDEAEDRGVTPGNVYHVNITGVVTQDVLDELFDRMGEDINHRDRVLINPNSRQAQELRESV